jgi:hypothetical protein
MHLFLPFPISNHASVSDISNIQPCFCFWHIQYLTMFISPTYSISYHRHTCLRHIQYPIMNISLWNMQYHSIHLTSTYPISNHRPTSDICNVQESTSLSHIQYSAMHLSDINIQSFIYRWHIQYLPINMYLRYPTPALTHPISNHSPVSDKSSIRPFTYRRNIQYLIVHLSLISEIRIV